MVTPTMYVGNLIELATGRRGEVLACAVVAVPELSMSARADHE
jgi:translation elongation factor EF-4